MGGFEKILQYLFNPGKHCCPGTCPGACWHDAGDELLTAACHARQCCSAKWTGQQRAGRPPRGHARATVRGLTALLEYRRLFCGPPRRRIPAGAPPPPASPPGCPGFEKTLQCLSNPPADAPGRVAQHGLARGGHGEHKPPAGICSSPRGANPWGGLKRYYSIFSTPPPWHLGPEYPNFDYSQS